MTSRSELKFKRMPSIFNGMEMFGCSKGFHSFVMTKDFGEWRVSYKDQSAEGAAPVYFGPYETREEAEAAINDAFRGKVN